MSNQHNTIRELTLENLRRCASEYQPASLGEALLLALEQTGGDLSTGPSLEEIKALLVDVSRAWKEQHRCDGKATAA